MKRKPITIASATFAAAAFAGLLVSAPAALAQSGSSQPAANPPASQQQSQPPQQNQPSQNQQQSPLQPAIPPPGQQGQQQNQAQAPKVDPAEEAAFKSLVGMPADTADNIKKQADAGKDFLQKYPNSAYKELVYNRIVGDYEKISDWNDFYDSSDKALALNPDDVDVLILTGWVIPHSTGSNDPQATQKLDKAEGYEKHALDLLAKLPKPAGLTDDQFDNQKKLAASQAHSGLGLVYFRRQNFATSANELQLAVDVPQPDPTDLYVLGLDLTQLKRFPEAADAFQKCSALSGSLQDRCKQWEDKVKGPAAQQTQQPGHK